MESSNPFPGMNPFIEAYKWPPFHASMIIYLQEALVEQLPDGYYVEAETNLYLATEDASSDTPHWPDVSILESNSGTTGRTRNSEILTPPTAVRPQGNQAVKSLRIFDSAANDLVTAIELLSPANKRNPGLVAYRVKRTQYQLSRVNFVEIDLLRRGERPDPAAAVSPYVIQVFDAATSDLFEWSVDYLATLPVIPVPLIPGTPPLVLQLQSVFDKTFALSSLGRRLRYDFAALRPAIPDESAAQLQRYVN